jgi:aldehyde dehydrogenase (NAD+)
MDARSEQDAARINHVPVEEGSKLELASLVEAQRRFFRSGATRSLEFRREQLENLKQLVRTNEPRILEALASDLSKPRFEAFASETGFIASELSHALAHLEEWMEPVRVGTPLTFFPASSSIRYEPMGVSLIIAPWNYPFQLVLAPLIAALAAGNCAIVKPSEWAAATSALLSELIAGTFAPELVSIATGGGDVAEALLKQRFDLIFFTGSAATGKLVARAAAEHLTPVTLELGGKNPAIVDERVNLKVTARRLTWGKFFNAGQTCIAPDYVLVPVGLKDDLVSRIQSNVVRFFGDAPQSSADFARIVNHRHFDRILGYLDQGRIVVGGDSDRAQRYIAPTLVDELPPGAKALSEEIFGPVLPIVSYESLDEAIAFTQRHPDPLAVYVFSKNRDTQERILAEVPFGGGAINDALIQFSNPELPFGGRGPSGVGSYHGRFGFERFSHRKSIVEGSTLFDPPLRYPPYSGKLRWLRKLVR